MSSEIAHLLTPPPESTRVLGPAEAPVPRLKNEYRYQLLIKAASRKVLNHTLNTLRAHAIDRKWNATALLIDVDPLTLM
jgi:primosomal protein N' (replication factor Y)